MKFLSKEKMGKRKKRELDSARRGTWDGVIPVTRTIENKKRYDRKKSPRRYDDDGTRILLFGGKIQFFACSCGSL